MNQKLPGPFIVPTKYWCNPPPPGTCTMSGKQRAVIICGFPCIGKTALKDSWKENQVYDMEAFGLGQKSYDAMVRKLASEDKSIILVGTSPELRQRLQGMGLRYVRVFPRDDVHVKEAWIYRQWRRDRDEAACERMRTRWDLWLRKVKDDFAGEISTRVWALEKGDYLEGLVPEIVYWFESHVL